MSRAVLTILLLVVSNVFMTLACYGHLKFKDWPAFGKLGIAAIILISWETFRLNHLIGFVFLVLAVYFIFKK